MKAVVIIVLSGLGLFSAQAAQAAGIWDSLPAIEPTHVQGLYVGTRMCPMCRHGYDSGILLFVPASLAAEKAEVLVRNLSPQSLRIQSPAFRVFIILSAGQPSQKLLAALKVDDPRWFVATLDGNELDKAERDLGEKVRNRSVGYVFAERRSLYRLDQNVFGSDTSQLQSMARFAAAIIDSGRTAPVREKVVGLPCENCEVGPFKDRPDRFQSIARIAPAEEPGEPLRIQGTVTTAGGELARDILVYAYQTNREGNYPRGQRATVMGLRGWARTDDQGRYTFDTIRPGAYTGRPDPAHIHMHIVEPGRCTYYIDDVQFTDDPRVRAAKVEKSDVARAGSGLVTPTKDSHGVWQATRDIHLGRNVPGYDQCGL